MRRESARILDTLVESIVVWARAVRNTWPLLVAVLLPMEIVTIGLSRLAIEHGMQSRMLNFSTSVIGFVLFLLAMAFLARSIQRQAGGEVCGGVRQTWLRMLASAVLDWLFSFLAFLIPVFAALGAALALKSPLASLGGVALGMVGGLVGLVVVAAFAYSLWLIIRWLFAVPLSAMYPVMGTTALKASVDFTQGRRLRCLLFVIASSLTGLGLSSALIVVRAHFVFGATLEADALGVPEMGLMADAVAVLCGVLANILGLYCFVAVLTFCRRTQELAHGENAVSAKGASKAAVILLMVLGVGASVWSIVSGVRTVRAQRDKAALQPLNAEEFERLVQRNQFEPPPQAEDVAAVEAVLANFPADDLDGSALMAACEAKGLSDSTAADVLQDKLKGKHIRFDIVRMSGGIRSSDDDSLVWYARLGKGKEQFDPRTGALLELRFPNALHDAALDLVSCDIITNVQGVVRELSDSDRRHLRRMDNDCQLVVDVASFATTKQREPLPEFDAKTVTAQELLALTGRRSTRISPRLFAELQRRLAGRRLTFTSLRPSGYGTKFAYDELDYEYYLYLDPTYAGMGWRIGGCCKDAATAELARKFYEKCDSSVQRRTRLITVTGVVLPPERIPKARRSFGTDCLMLEIESIAEEEQGK